MCCRCWRIYLLLLIKNLILQIRSWVFTIVEIILPALFVLILVAIRVGLSLNPEAKSAVSWGPISIANTTIEPTPGSDPLIIIDNIIKSQPNSFLFSVFPIPNINKTINPLEPKYNKIVNFAPNTSHVREIRDRFDKSKLLELVNGWKLVNTKLYETEEEMVKAMQRAQTNDQFIPSRQLAGIVIDVTNKSNGGLKISYKLRFDAELRGYFDFAKINLTDFKNGTNASNFTELLGKYLKVTKETARWDTQILYPILGGQGPRKNGSFNFTGNSPGYFWQGFITLQAAIDQAIIQYRTSQLDNVTLPNLSVTLNQFSYPNWVKDSFVAALSQGLPLLLMLSFLIPTMLMTRGLVYEKEKRLKESLKIMGAGGLSQKLASFTNNFMLLFLTIILVIIIMKTGGLFVDSSYLLFFIFLTLYITATIAFAGLVASLFSNANLATAAAGILFFAAFVPYFFIQSDLSYSTTPTQLKIVLCLLSNCGMALGTRIFAEFEARSSGATFSTIRTSPVPGDDFQLIYVLILLWFDIKLYTVIAWYIETVFPGEYGVPQPFYFLFTSSYWCGKPILCKPKVRKLENSMEHLEFMESEPRECEVGIEIIELIKEFGGLCQKKKIAVDGISLKMYKDQVTVLLGHNGAGKTTTMSMLTGLFPPTSGAASINGYDIRYQMSKIRRNLGLCPQHDVLYDKLTVREHLWFFGMLKGSSWSSANKEANELMTALGIDNKKREYSKNLSGGMKRKLSVAIALIGGSEFVILDEPTTGMDPGARRDTWDVLMRYKKNKTVMLTTHFMDEADFLGDRIAIMSNGKIKCCGSPLFLKDKYGVGYHMICVKNEGCKTKEVEKLIKSYIPEAKRESNIAAELTYILPKERSGQFPKLFRKLDEVKDNLGVESYGVSLTTIEEVFLKVGSQDNEEANEIIRGENNSIAIYANQGLSDKVNSTNGITYGTNSLSQNAVSSFINSESNRRVKVKYNPLEHIPKAKTQNTIKLWLLQFYAMLIKRALNTRRNYIAIIPQLLIPFLFTLLAIIVTIAVPQTLSDDNLLISLKSYKESNIPLISTNSTMKKEETLKSYLSAEAASYNLAKLSNMTMEKYIFRQYNEIGNIKTDQTHQIGMEFKEGESIAWFSNQGLHMVPLALNVMNNVIMKGISGLENDTIEVTNHPLPLDLDSQVSNLEGIAIGFSVAFDMVFGMAFLASSFVLFIVDERSSKAKHIQNVSGVKLSTFWLASMVWDMLNYIVPCIGIIILFAAFQVPAYTGSNLAVVALLLIEYGWSIIPLMYVLSYFFNKATTAFTLLVLFNVATGCAAVLIIFMLQLLNATDAANAMKWVFLFMPNYCLGQGLSDMVVNHFLRNTCNQDFEHQEFCAISHTIYQNNTLALDNPGVGRYAIAMAAEGIIFFIALIIIESEILFRILKFIRSLFSRHTRYAIDANESQNADTDVIAEKTRILDQTQEFYLNPYNSNNILTLYNISKAYGSMIPCTNTRPQTIAVKNMCLGVEPGEIFGLLGQNGAGKSTTFKMITGDEEISDGSAFIRGINLKWNVAKATTLMGYCPQYDALISRMTGRELLYMYGRIRGISGNCLKDEVNDVIKRLHIEQYADKRSGTYSGGNKRKLSTGIALIGGPPLLLLDEPTSGMDPVSRRLLWDTLIGYSQEGHCIVITSHSMEECEALCNRLTIMVNGEMKCLGTLQHLKNKFGSGYTLVVKHKQEATGIINHVTNRFPRSDIRRAHAGIITFKVPQNLVSLADVFECVEEIKDTIETYGVMQTTLEQVFLDLTATQHEDTRNRT